MPLNHPDQSSTCWTMIRDAASGDAVSIDAFARVYEPVIRSFLRMRWQQSARQTDIEDAVQDVFLECLRPGGVLAKVELVQHVGFRKYLFGVVRNIALRHETRKHEGRPAPEPVADESSVGRSFDRDYANAIMKEAARWQAKAADQLGAAAVRRLELLQLRFEQNLAIRDIARLWSVEPAKLHHEYAVARNEFRTALRAVVKFHNPAAFDLEINEICTDLLGCLE